VTTRFTECCSRAWVSGAITTFSTANYCPLDHRTTAAGTSIRCSFGNVTVKESVSPGDLVVLRVNYAKWHATY